MNSTSIRLEMTAAQSCFLFEISQPNPSHTKNSGKAKIILTKSDDTQPEQLLSLFYLFTNKNFIKLVF